MLSHATLEKIRDRLAREAAVVDHAGDAGRRLTAAGSLLRGFAADDMPTRAARGLWIEITQTMLRLSDETVTADELDGLRNQIVALQKLITTHLGAMAPRDQG